MKNDMFKIGNTETNDDEMLGDSSIDHSIIKEIRESLSNSFDNDNINMKQRDKWSESYHSTQTSGVEQHYYNRQVDEIERLRMENQRLRMELDAKHNEERYEDLLRKTNPTLIDAWNQYQTIRKLIGE